MSMVSTPLPSVLSPVPLSRMAEAAPMSAAFSSIQSMPVTLAAGVVPSVVSVIVIDVAAAGGVALGGGNHRGFGLGCHVGGRYRNSTAVPAYASSRTIIVPLNVTESAGAVVRTTSDVLP